MKNKISIFLLAFTLLFATHIEGIAAEQVKIGVAASVQDTVQAIREKRVRLKSGMDIYLNDRIVTGKTGSLQIMLLDETIFTLGANSDMVLGEFIYDPSNDKGKVSAKVAKGVFRFITGKIARHDPSKMNVKIPAGNIGIRGTIVAGRTGPKGSTVILAGPGVKNNAGERPGAIIISGEQKNWFSKNSEPANQQYINTPGEGTTISPEGFVAKPRMMRQELTEINWLLGYKQKTIGKSNKGKKKEAKIELEEDDEEELNDKSGQGDADTKEEAADNENKQNITNSANSDIMQGNQEKVISDTTENSKKAVLYAELPYLGISRASYQTSSEISGTKNDGSPIKRGLLFGTVVNFIDKYLQNTYLAITSEDKSIKYGEAVNSTYVEIIDKPGGETSFNWEGTLSDNSASADPELGAGYGDFNIDMQLFNTAANPMPSLSADITINHNSGAGFFGSYDMNSSLYAGKLTNGEMLKYAAEKSPEAVFKSEGVLNPQNHEALLTTGISKINFDMLSKVNFYSGTLSDMVLSFTPVNTENTAQGTTVFYSNENYSFISQTTADNYRETSDIVLSNENFTRFPSESNTDVIFPDDSYFYVSLMDYSSPALEITGLTATLDNYSDYNYTADSIRTALASDYSYPLTIYEFGRLGSGTDYAEYHSSEKINLFNTYTDQNNYGISAKNFSASVDFINNTVANTTFEISVQNASTSNTERNFTVTQINDADIVPYYFSSSYKNPSEPGGTASLENQNKNMTAMARIPSDSFLQDDTIYNIGDIFFNETMADIYFGYEDSISFPVMKLNLATTYNVYSSTSIKHVTMEPVNLYGSQQAPLNFSDVFAPYSQYALSGSVLPDSMKMIADYTAKGKWQGTNGAEYDTEFTGKFNFINGTYSDALAKIDNNVIYSNDKGLISSLASGSNPSSVIIPLSQVEGMSFPVQEINAEVSFYEYDKLEVPSISVVLTAASDPENVFSGNSTLTTTDKNFSPAFDSENYMSSGNISQWLSANTGKTAVWQHAYNVSSAPDQAPAYVQATTPLTINFTAASSHISAQYRIIGTESVLTDVSADISNTGDITETYLKVNGADPYETDYVNFNFINNIQAPDVLVDISLDQQNISAQIYNTGYTTLP